MAYAGEVLEPWKKYEPMAKARFLAPLVHGEALNAKPPAKRERPKTFVNAFALPPPLPKKVHSSVVAGSRVLPRTMLALHTIKDDALAPLNCAITIRPLPGPEVSDNQVCPFPSLFLIVSFIYIFYLLVILSFIYTYIYIYIYICMYVCIYLSIYLSTRLTLLPLLLFPPFLGSFFSHGL